MRWELTVRGSPAVKGSWDICPHAPPRAVDPRTKEKAYRVRDLHLKPQESERLARWKHALELAVLEAGRPKVPIADAPVSVQTVFYLHRPKKPEHDQPIGRVGDLDKLQRAVGDVLTGVYYADDSQIVDWTAAKVYEDADHPEGAAIVIEVIEHEQRELTSDRI